MVSRDRCEVRETEGEVQTLRHAAGEKLLGIGFRAAEKIGIELGEELHRNEDRQGNLKVDGPDLALHRMELAEQSADRFLGRVAEVGGGQPVGKVPETREMVNLPALHLPFHSSTH